MKENRWTRWHSYVHSSNLELRSASPQSHGFTLYLRLYFGIEEHLVEQSSLETFIKFKSQLHLIRASFNKKSGERKYRVGGIVLFLSNSQSDRSPAKALFSSALSFSIASFTCQPRTGHYFPVWASIHFYTLSTKNLSKPSSFRLPDMSAGRL